MYITINGYSAKLASLQALFTCWCTKVSKLLLRNHYNVLLRLRCLSITQYSKRKFHRFQPSDEKSVEEEEKKTRSLYRTLHRYECTGKNKILSVHYAITSKNTQRSKILQRVVQMLNESMLLVTYLCYPSQS